MTYNRNPAYIVHPVLVSQPTLAPYVEVIAYHIPTLPRIVVFNLELSSSYNDATCTYGLLSCPFLCFGC